MKSGSCFDTQRPFPDSGCQNEDQVSSSSPYSSWCTKQNPRPFTFSTEDCHCPWYKQEQQGNQRSMFQINQKSVQNIFFIFFFFLLLSPGFVTGLRCYDCLSLACDSSQICESIKDTINSTFGRNSHYIHFDPRVSCPGPHVPTNSTEWSEVVFNCTRSDSVCLEAPIEVISSFDGMKERRRLEPGKIMSSNGFVRGCASRRALRELPSSIPVRKFTMENETLKYKSTDQYKIEKIHYHEVYVDQGTENATKCYMDGCNNKKKHRVRSGGSTRHFSISKNPFFLCLILSYILNYLQPLMSN